MPWTFMTVILPADHALPMIAQGIDAQCGAGGLRVLER
ncbi:hypothetical protein ACCUM_4308 [Candidatus Accumulibacter phosphatis]|uniref:Uncharacterized protein n=1 Tax=Candidatus Accumulibacter phosphatis TaxID=327160 RepID=A0A5S4EM42_9PROT|nr:hypothetical protein ACCUM_4308 [Candidatus Accumulibacter phosphatis]